MYGLLAANTWEDVGMACVQQVLVPLVLVLVYWFKLRSLGNKTDNAAACAKAAAVTSVESFKASKANSDALTNVCAGLAENTGHTMAAAEAGAVAASAAVVTAAEIRQAINGGTTVLHNRIAELEKALAEARAVHGPR